MSREQKNMGIVALMLAALTNAVMYANVNFDLFAAIGNAYLMTLAIALMYKASRKPIPQALPQ